MKKIIKSFGNPKRIPSFWILWNSFRRSGTTSSLYMWYNSSVNPSGPELFLVGRLLLLPQLQKLVIGLLKVSTPGLELQVSRNLSGFSRFTGLCA